jgi:hypothetical protein
MGHLSLEVIISYFEDQKKGKETDEIEAHLATCEKCHEIYMGLRSIEETLKCSFKGKTPSAFCPEDWESGALVKGESQSELANVFSNHMRTCNFCVDRAAIYYKNVHKEEKTIKTPELWKHKAIQALKTDNAIKEAEASLFQQTYSILHRILTPLPPLPGYAAAALAILMLIIWNVVPQREKIVTVASSERIIKRDSEIPSAFGFMATGESKEVENMKIFHEGNVVVFRWGSIDDAVKYKFSLRSRSETIYSGSVEKDVKVSLEKGVLKRNTIYTWLITGESKDGKYFEYTGDFLLVK